MNLGEHFSRRSPLIVRSQSQRAEKADRMARRSIHCQVRQDLAQDGCKFESVSRQAGGEAHVGKFGVGVDNEMVIG